MASRGLWMPVANQSLNEWSRQGLGIPMACTVMLIRPDQQGMRVFAESLILDVVLTCHATSHGFDSLIAVVRSDGHKAMLAFRYLATALLHAIDSSACHRPLPCSMLQHGFNCWLVGDLRL